MDSLYRIIETNEQAKRRALEREALNIADLIEDIDSAMAGSGRKFAAMTPIDQLATLAFAHSTLGNCLQHRAEHGLI